MYPRHRLGPEVGDPGLDRWLAAFDARQLDWDDVFLGPPERELAWAAWEWGDGLLTLDLGPAMAFVARYANAGGTATLIGEEELAQLVRERLCMDIGYNRAAWRAGAPRDPDDIEYEARQREAFRALRP